MQNYPNKTKEMFIVRALEKILGDKDIKRQGQLKKACETAIATLKGTTFFHSYIYILSYSHDCFVSIFSYVVLNMFAYIPLQSISIKFN